MKRLGGNLFLSSNMFFKAKTRIPETLRNKTTSFFRKVWEYFQNWHFLIFRCLMRTLNTTVFLHSSSFCACVGWCSVIEGFLKNQRRGSWGIAENYTKHQLWSGSGTLQYVHPTTTLSSQDEHPWSGQRSVVIQWSEEHGLGALTQRKGLWK